MNLNIPPEPLMLKKQSTEQKGRKWDIDSLVLWFGNRLPTYLWNDAGWSKPLKAEGYNWQSFLKILSLHKKEMIKCHLIIMRYQTNRKTSLLHHPKSPGVLYRRLCGPSSRPRPAP
jgi:hypothetical protein